jgi:6-phosphogluconate dehydrogenase
MASDIGITGLAVMGQNLARNMARHGFGVALHNRSEHRTRDLIDQYGNEGAFTPTTSLEELVRALAPPRRILVMVKAGQAVDQVTDHLATLLDRGDIIIDGGNSHFEDTRRREADLREKGLHFIGTGVSGGEEGALNGPSIMPGGSVESYQAVEPIFTAIAANVDGVPCCTHVGPDGAGHYVKMVHNGIEYADMQLIAEAYDLLTHVGGLAAPEIAAIFDSWNEGDLESFLVEITAKVLGHVDETTQQPLVDVILDEAEQKGTGRWTAQSALELGVPITAITEAVYARSLSARKAQRAAASRVLAGPSRPSGAGPGAADRFVEDVRAALYASKVVAYAQGFEHIAAGSSQYGWGIDPGAMATIWRGGCIIRARFLDRIRAAYDRDPGLTNLLLDDYFRDGVAAAQDAWRRVIRAAVDAGVPVPAFASSLAYYDGYRRERGPANLIQGLRDFFGAHTYRRTDRPGTFHTRWGQDGKESEV